MWLMAYTTSAIFLERDIILLFPSSVDLPKEVHKLLQWEI